MGSTDKARELAAAAVLQESDAIMEDARARADIDAIKVEVNRLDDVLGGLIRWQAQACVRPDGVIKRGYVDAAIQGQKNRALRFGYDDTPIQGEFRSDTERDMWTAIVAAAAVHLVTAEQHDGPDAIRKAIALADAMVAELRFSVVARHNDADEAF